MIDLPVNPNLSRRSLLAGLLSSAAVIAAGPVATPFPVPIIDQTAARLWKLKFAAEFAKAVDVASCPNVLEMMCWITSEADGAFDGLDDPLSADPIEEAREAVYCIGACA